MTMKKKTELTVIEGDLTSCEPRAVIRVRQKTEATPPVIMDEMNDPALMEATIRIAAALVSKVGAMNPAPAQGDEVAKAALVYARAVVNRVRG